MLSKIKKKIDAANLPELTKVRNQLSFLKKRSAFLEDEISRLALFDPVEHLLESIHPLGSDSKVFESHKQAEKEITNNNIKLNGLYDLLEIYEAAHKNLTATTASIGKDSNATLARSVTLLTAVMNTKDYLVSHKGKYPTVPLPLLHSNAFKANYKELRRVLDPLIEQYKCEKEMKELIGLIEDIDIPKNLNDLIAIGE